MTQHSNNKFSKTVFIVSTGRTATQAIANYFNDTYQDITATHEPKPSRRFRVLSNMYLCNKISLSAVSGIFRFSRKSLFKSIDSDIYIEANPFLHGCLPALKNLYPDAYFIHITRDPRTYITSHINHGVFRGLKGLAGKYFPYWLLKPDYYAPDSGLKWNQLSQQERLAWRWNTINIVLDQGQEIFSGRYFRVKYEDLFNNDREGLITIAKWLDLPGIASLVECSRKKRHNASKGQSFPGFNEWDIGIQNAVLRTCEDRMKSYGYSINSGPQA